jgi:hypothetical protein
MSLTVLRSVHSAPPTWSVHDDGGGWDGVDCSSQVLSYAKRALAVKLESRYLRRLRRGIAAELAVQAENMSMRKYFSAWIAAAALMLSGVLFAATPPEVDLNMASVAELMQVKGMTAVWAERIVRFRPYRSKADLVGRGVVTAEVYARIRDGVVAHRGAAAAKPKKSKERGGQDSY